MQATPAWTPNNNSNNNNNKLFFHSLVKSGWSKNAVNATPLLFSSVFRQGSAYILIREEKREKKNAFPKR